jgi:hypothetical protein
MGGMDLQELSPSRAATRAGAAFAEGVARGFAQAEQVMPWMDYIESLTFCRLDLTPEERAARHAAYLATTWRAHDFEPPAHVTRVRSADGRDIAIRGAECWFEGPGHSNWAYVLVNGQPRTPGPDSSVPEDTGWYCWLDLDVVNPRWADDTANDTRREA